jgi:hypothetical protein
MKGSNRCVKTFEAATALDFGTIKREFNLFKLCSNETLDDLHYQHDMTLTYWRKNRRQYHLEGV